MKPGSGRLFVEDTNRALSGETPSVPAAVAYGLLQFPLGLAIPPMTLMIPAFFSETMGLSLAAVGAIAGSMRLIHLVTDPLTGALSDRTHTRFGRRRPWIVAGAGLALISIWMLFAPPVRTATPQYLALALFLFYLATSLIQIPYYAWGAEYPATPYGRARMLSIREVIALAGVLLSGLAPLFAALAGFRANGREAMGALAIGLAVALPAAVAVLVLAVPEPLVRPADVRTPSLLDTARDFWRALATNRAYRICVIGFQSINIGLAVGQSISYFYLSRILHLEKLFGVLLLILGVCAVVSAPLWVALSKRFEVRAIIAVCCIAAAVFHALGFLVLPPGQPIPLLAIEIVTALLMTPVIILSPTIQALAIEQGALDAGVDRAGTYVSLNQLVSQVANAAPFIALFPLLAWAGFEPAAKTTPPHALAALRFAGIFGPAPFEIFGALIVLSFPIDRKRATANAALILAQEAR
jgi:GPH family glycoside/pentoside/hexuronide:cation symporter